MAEKGKEQLLEREGEGGDKTGSFSEENPVIMVLLFHHNGKKNSRHIGKK